MARSFTPLEKDNIREKLIIECEKSWAVHGYKKTSIDELCTSAGISKGAFYLFFDSKEILFCNVLDHIQERLIRMMEGVLAATPTKADISQMLKQIYIEYDKTNILAQRNSPEFTTFLNRAPSEWKEKSQMINDNFILETIFNSNLKLKIEKQKAMGIFNALLSIVTTKETMGYDHYEVFCTLLDSVIDKIYE